MIWIDNWAGDALILLLSVQAGLPFDHYGPGAHESYKPIAIGFKTFREPGEKRVEFSNPKIPKFTHRPAARYLYFHYCMQVLQKAWQNKAQGKATRAATMLKAENVKSLWGTRGRYLPHNMLLAFVEELGHDYDELLEGRPSSS